MNKFVTLVVAVSLLCACSSSSKVTSDLAGQDGLGNPDGSGPDGAGLPDWNLGDIKGWDKKTPPDPGKFGAPCESNDDCDSGFCIEGPGGNICTSLCVEDCPAGFACVGVSVGSDLIFICIPPMDKSCEPCSSDLQCNGGKCVDFGTAYYCLAPCDSAQCNDGYSCDNVAIGGDGHELCVPDTATCECTPESIGMEKACKTASGPLTCYGIQFCTAEGWGGCTLPEEYCDGKDNNCDGVVDEGMLNQQTLIYDTDEHCGVCNNSCKAMTGTHSAGFCEPSGTIPACKWQCDDGYFDVNVNPNDGCECQYLSEQDDPDVPGDANCDGIDGVAADGVFVSKDGSDANPGSWEEPVLTIQGGILTAANIGKPNVYVATGVYQESVALEEDVAIYGGYSSDFAKRNSELNQTAIMGKAFSDTAPGAVNCIDIQQGNTALSGFHIFGEDAFDSGGSSYAVYVSNCDDSLRLVGNSIFAGNGRDGQHGADGTDGVDGLDGMSGSPAKYITTATCTGGHWTDGGSGGNQTCGATMVNGGGGGTAICPDYDESGSQPKSSPFDQTLTDGEHGQPGAGPAPGSGGGPGYDSLITNPCSVCNVPKKANGEPFLYTLGADGAKGSEGNDGTLGSGCGDQGGQVADGLWAGAAGAGGGNGQNGSGGGGGGAGGGVETIGCSGIPNWEYTDLGGSGGGGGSGACAGHGGEGAKPGGGSFAIFISMVSDPDALPVLTGNFVQTGYGGDGGYGGSGGVGGEGGDGGAAGASGDAAGGNPWCADAGGHGGNGGGGGHGGGGGGACGGPSYGVFLWGADVSLGAAYVDQNQFSLLGLPGAAGGGGKSVGESGADGLAGAWGETNF